MVQECDTLAENYSWRIASACGRPYALGFRTTWAKGFEGSRFLLELAIREVCMLFDESNFFRDGGDGHWCFDDYSHDWHTPETLSRVVYERICVRTFRRLHNSFGLDPLSISRVAGMAYESRNTEGEIAFHTGDLPDTWEGIKFSSLRRTPASYANSSLALGKTDYCLYGPAQTNPMPTLAI